MNISNVVVTKKNTIKSTPTITSNAINAVAPVTLKPIPTVSAINENLKMSSLADVNIDNLANGDVLIYNGSSKEWIAEEMTFENIIGNLDGGTF